MKPEDYLKDSPEIKFRAWAGDKMKEASTIMWGHYYQFKWGCFDYPLMQYTGMVDKNNVEIYEGDILGMSPELQDKSRFVVVKKTSGFLKHYIGFDYEFDAITHFDINTLRFHVIGNIFENPELLK